MSTPKVSVIVPVYNVEKYLERCIESLWQQTLSDIEIVLVDDCATDTSPSICDKLACQDTRIKVVHKPVNQGLGMARNTGIENASGQYVMFLDSDDTYAPDACERLYSACEENHAEIATGNFNKEVAPGKWIASHTTKQVEVISGSSLKEYLLDMIACKPEQFEERKHPVSACILCIKHRLIINSGTRFLSEREVASEDTLFKIELLQKCSRMVVLGFPFYNYYINETSLSHTFKLSAFDKLPILMHKMQSLFAADDTEAKIRIYRFITSDARGHIMKLLSSTNASKIKTLKYMLTSPIWTNDCCFPIDKMPFSKRLYLKFCQGHRSLLVYAYSKILLLR